MSALPGMYRSAIGQVLARLKGVRLTGEGWNALCPAHEDRTPSLSVREAEDGRVLLHCHAGCSTDEVVVAMGLTMHDLFADSETAHPRTNREGFVSSVSAPPGRLRDRDRSFRRIVTRYEYQDAEGTLLFRVVRFEPKGFAQQRLDGRGVWIWGLGDVQPVLYRLPEVREAAAAGRVVFVVEGEKDADNLCTLGLVATTSPMGAGKWLPEFAEALRGAHVAVIPDNDAPGRAHAEQVARSLVGIAQSVRLGELPWLGPKGDVTDWLDQGHTARELRRLVRDTPLWVFPSLEVAPEAREDDWPEPEPLPTGLPPVKSFALDLLPESLRPWVADISERMQCPPEYVAVAVMVGLGSLVARRIAIRPKAQDDWTVIPNLWGIVIGKPGVLKTPAILEALGSLRRLETEAAVAHGAALREWEARQQVANAERSVLQERFKKQLKDGADREALARQLVELAADPKPPRTRHLVNDSTVEALTEILRDNPGGVLVYRDELLGLLYHLDREGQEHARAFYLEGWNGGQSYESNRIGRGDTRVPDNTLSMLGGIQPGPLRAYLKGGVPGAQDDGLIQRFQLAVYPDVSAEWENVDRRPDRKARERAAEVFASLANLDHEALPALGAERDIYAAPEARLFFRFTPEAQAEFDTWRGGLERRVRSDEEHPALTSHLAKYRSLVPSLALIIHLAEGRSGPVGLDALLASLAWAEYLESHARRMYAGVAGLDTVPAHALAAKLRAGALPDGFTLRDVYRPQWAGLARREDAQLAVELLTDLGWLRAEAAEAVETGGRPTTIYRITPHIREAR